MFYGTIEGEMSLVFGGLARYKLNILSYEGGQFKFTVDNHIYDCTILEVERVTPLGNFQLKFKYRRIEDEAACPRCRRKYRDSNKN